MCLSLAVLAWSAPVFAQGVDYHKAQQAGQVWQKKQQERNLQDKNRKRTNSLGVAHDAPLTPADLEATRRNNPGQYERFVRSIGQKNADRWLEARARLERSQR